jgi:hypothetical protein
MTRPGEIIDSIDGYPGGIDPADQDRRSPACRSGRRSRWLQTRCCSHATGIRIREVADL